MYQIRCGIAYLKLIRSVPPSVGSVRGLCRMRVGPRRRPRRVRTRRDPGPIETANSSLSERDRRRAVGVRASAARSSLVALEANESRGPSRRTFQFAAVSSGPGADR